MPVVIPCDSGFARLRDNNASGAQGQCRQQGGGSTGAVCPLRGWFRCIVSLLFCFAFYAAATNNAQLSYVATAQSARP